MSRFEIRKRLRRVMRAYRRWRAGPIERYDVVMHLPDGSRHVVSAEKHYTLVMASQVLDTPIHTSCPDGTCGLCAVRVVKGMESLSPVSEMEQEVMDRVMGERRRPNIRLACHARVMGPGIEIKVGRVWHIEDAVGPKDEPEEDG